ncbi:MAG: hypothetical protein J6Y07_03900 [Alphaproteobacteria bacterium]|nr:hypothetical protein [Alphaproteobacteria bacterium]
MTQKYGYNIKQEIQNLVLNYPKRVIRVSTDYNTITIGRLQIENLNWEWQYEMSNQLSTYLMWDPYDCMSPAPFNKFRGNFVVTKYGLSYREKPLTFASYTPLWKPGTPKEQQAKIMAEEMTRMQKEGAKKCENGIEIVSESPLWDVVNSLSIKARDTFIKLLGQKVKDLEARGIKYDDEKVLDDGVRVTPEIAELVKKLGNQITH